MHRFYIKRETGEHVSIWNCPEEDHKRNLADGWREVLKDDYEAFVAEQAAKRTQQA